MTALNDYWRAFEPSPEIGLAEYSIRNVVNEEGRPFDYLAFPHMVAPGGPCDAFDSPWVREIVLQFASRLGKTFFVLCGSLYFADLAPCNQILAGHVQDLAMQQAERIRQMGEYNPKFDRSGLQTSLKTRLRFNGNTIYAAWARSPGTLSNVNALYGGASELDLWEQITTSKHPDPEAMFGDRFKDNDALRKEVYESIPTLSGTYVDQQGHQRPRSRIAARRRAGTDCRYWVACPTCRHRQVLTIQNVNRDGYECSGCGKTIRDEQSKVFIRSGVWLPDGCAIDNDKADKAAEERLELLGRAADISEDDDELRACRDRLAWHGWKACDYITNPPAETNVAESFQLSSLYALSLSWRRIADQDHGSQNFINQWLGETFHVEEDEQFDLDAAARELHRVIVGELPRGQVPDWATIRVLTIDRQKRSFPWMLSTWSETLERVHIPAAGVVLGFDELEQIAEAEQPDVILMDCGYLQKDTYDWCLSLHDAGFYAMPCKGSTAAAVQQHFKLNTIEDEKGRKRTYRRIKRVDINTQSTQEWVTKLLESADRLRAWNDANHFALCQELLNEVETVNRTSRTWDRATQAVPNDQRDNLRYAFAAAQIAKQQRDARAKERPRGPRTESKGLKKRTLKIRGRT